MTCIPFSEARRILCFGYCFVICLAIYLYFVFDHLSTHRLRRLLYAGLWLHFHSMIYSLDYSTLVLDPVYIIIYGFEICVYVVYTWSTKLGHMKQLSVSCS